MKNGKKGLLEAIRFAVTGGVCFLVEYAVLVLLHEKAGLDTLLAAPVAFLVSVILNYILCVVWVFRAKGGGAAKAGFLLTSLIGLALNELFMYVFRVLLGEDTVIAQVFGFNISMYMVNKALATLLVMVWNYFTKRYILRRSADGASA